MRAVTRLSRALLFRPGTSSEQLPASRRLFSTQTADANDADEFVKDTRDVDFVARLKALQPSENFKKSLDNLEKRTLNSILPEIELFVYMGSKVPVSLDDEEWADLIKRKTVAQRVEYLEFVAVRRRRQTFTDNKVSRKAIEFEQIMAEQNAIAEAGGMGYGPRLNELIMNPFRSSKQMNLIEGGRIWTAMRLERPRVIFDLQFTSKMEAKNFKVITRHLSYCVTENFHSRDPLPLSFANASRDNNEYRSLQHNIGHFKGEYTHQKIMPELALRDVRTLCGQDKNILYISRHAREMLDGPLTADGYVICASMDNERESLGAARKGGFRAVRLPIEKYVKWVSGHKVLPFPNIMRILREVHTSGGDWRTALQNNIAKRHFQSDEERESRGLTARTKLTRLARMELVQAIRDATGNK